MTVLTGFNSAGKSTVSQAILAVTQTQMQLGALSTGSVRLSGPLVDLGTFRDLVKDGSGVASFEIELTIDDHAVSWEFSADQDDPLGLTAEVRRVEKGGSAANLQSLSWIPADRCGPGDIFPLWDLSRQRTIGSNGSIGLLHQLRDDKLGQEDSRRHPDPQASLRLPAQVAAWLATLFPGVRIDVQQITGTEMVRLAIRTDDAHEFRKPRHVGFGVSYALPIVVALLAAPRGAAVVVDSPEVHLHPRAQSIVGRLCALAAQQGVQVILETHSEHILNAVRLELKRGTLLVADTTVAFFSSAGLQPAILKLNQSGSIDSWPGGFFDESFVQLDQLL